MHSKSAVKYHTYYHRLVMLEFTHNDNVSVTVYDMWPTGSESWYTVSDRWLTLITRKNFPSSDIVFISGRSEPA
jgi:hypothetical protein